MVVLVGVQEGFGGHSTQGQGWDLELDLVEKKG